MVMEKVVSYTVKICITNTVPVVLYTCLRLFSWTIWKSVAYVNLFNGYFWKSWYAIGVFQTTALYSGISASVLFQIILDCNSNGWFIRLCCFSCESCCVRGSGHCYFCTVLYVLVLLSNCRFSWEYYDNAVYKITLFKQITKTGVSAFSLGAENAYCAVNTRAVWNAYVQF